MSGCDLDIFQAHIHVRSPSGAETVVGRKNELTVSKGLVLQRDCPDLAMERHGLYQDEPLEVFQDVVRLHIEAINHALQNIPREQVRLHVCWGDTEGPHIYDVPLEDILPLAYGANVGALVKEMANPRHAHEYKSYQRFPILEHMLVVTGVIDTKTNYVEHPSWWLTGCTWR